MRRREFLLGAGAASGLALLPRTSRSAGTTENADRPLEIGVGPQLFLDDYLIERPSSTVLVRVKGLAPPQGSRLIEPAIEPDPAVA